MKLCGLLIMLSIGISSFGQSNQKGVFRTDTSTSDHIIDLEYNIAHGSVSDLGYNYLYNFNKFFSLGTRIGFYFYNNKKGGILPEDSKYGLKLSYGLIANLRIWQSVFFEFRANHVPTIQWPTQENTNDSGISISESVFYRIQPGLRVMFFDRIMLRLTYTAIFDSTPKNWYFRPTFSIGYKF